jgi:SulP family sulfate permease
MLSYDADAFRRDLGASLATTAMAVPQGIAYALIAGLPPVAGLYAACIPAIVGALARSSRHVVTGPTNALSLLVGGAVLAGSWDDPMATAMVLALLVGVMQLTAGILRLGVLVDYISNPVVLGYITGAGVLIGVGQLHNLTGTERDVGHLGVQLASWAVGLADTSAIALATGLVVAAGIIAVKRWRRTVPGPAIMLGLATFASWLLDFSGLGVQTVGDLASVPAGMPPFGIPAITPTLALQLVPIAIAATVLSLVESSSVARSVSIETGQHLDLDREFAGQGLANITAAFTGGYPTSGSLTRSVINSTAATRMGGVFGGLLVLAVLLVAGPIVNLTPISALAGMLVVVAYGLIDTTRIRNTLRTRIGDVVAFIGTLIGTWVLPLDQAIYVGVALSIGLFLRRVRHVVIRPLVLDDEGRLREGTHRGEVAHACPAVHILHIEGQLFFAAAAAVQQALVDATADPTVRVLILRLKRTQGLDITAAEVLGQFGQRMSADGRHLLLVGMRERPMNVLVEAGVEDALGADHLFPTQTRWFAAMDDAIHAALALADPHDCEHCPLETYSESRNGATDTLSD